MRLRRGRRGKQAADKRPCKATGHNQAAEGILRFKTTGQQGERSCARWRTPPRARFPDLTPTWCAAERATTTAVFGLPRHPESLLLEWNCCVSVVPQGESPGPTARPPGDRLMSFLLDTDICSAHRKSHRRTCAGARRSSAHSSVPSADTGMPIPAGAVSRHNCRRRRH